MTLTQIIYNVLNIENGGLTDKDERFSERQMAFIANYCRAYLIKGSLGDVRRLDYQYTQDLGAWQLETVDAADSCAVVKWCDDVKKVTIPKVLDLPDRRAYTFFGLIDKITHIPVYSSGVFEFDKNRKFIHKKIRGYQVGHTVYVINAEKLKWVNMQFVLEDPTDAKISTVVNDNCVVRCFNPDTDDYPIPTSLLPQLTQMMFDHIKNGKVLPVAAIDDGKEAS